MDLYGIQKTNGLLKMSVDLSNNLFSESASLGRFSHRVAMPVCVWFCGSAPSGAVFSEASLVLRSHVGELHIFCI